MLRTLVVTHVLLDYRYMDDVTENFFFVQFTWCAVLKMSVILFRIEQVKALKKFTMSYLQRGKMEDF